MLCKYCDSKLEVEDDVDGSIWITCPMIVKAAVDPLQGTDHDVYLVTEDDDGKVILS